MLKTFILKNGIKVATYSVPQMRSIYLRQDVKGGSIFDHAETSGTAHYMEHILVQGIPSLPTVEDFSDYIEGIAGSYAASTSIDDINFGISAPVTKIREVLKIGGEVFFEPLFAPDAIEREREAVMQEIRQRQDSLGYKNYQFKINHRYKGDHPLKLDTGGTLQSVANIKREDLVGYWSKFFQGKNTHLVLVGGFEDSEGKKLIEGAFEKFPAGKKFVGFPKLTNNDFTSKTVAIREDKELKACYVDLSFPSVYDSLPLEIRIRQGVIKSIFGNLRSSRLYRLLRQKKGLVYDVGITSASYYSFGYGDIYTQVAADRLDEVLGLVIAELKAFIASGPTKEELEFAVNYTNSRSLMSFDNPSSIANWIEGELLWEDKIHLPEDYIKASSQITVKSLIEFMQKYWDFAKLNLTIQGPIENSKKNLDKYKEMIKGLK